MRCNKAVVVACAGSRKTSSIVEEALRISDKRVLVTTYTNENVEQIVSYIVQKQGCIPPHISVISWYSFLLRDGIRPYQNFTVDAERIRTINFTAQPNRFIPKSNAKGYYLLAGDIFSDRAADFVCECDKRSGGLVITRLERIYDTIFIDEIQDFNGYDLEILDRLFRSRISIIAVGDPRQATFSTNKASKNKQYKGSRIAQWIEEKQAEGILTVEERVQCYRSNQAICDFADALYPGLAKTVSMNTESTGHDGVFYAKRSEVLEYYETYKPLVLRYSKQTDTMGLPASNIGAMKGKTFDRVLIFPTRPMLKYLQTKNPADAGDLAKLYVAVTRARYSVAFAV